MVFALQCTWNRSRIDEEIRPSESNRVGTIGKKKIRREDRRKQEKNENGKGIEDQRAKKHL
ncbi:hypothetical protein ASPZODRAFT_130318 [Penicilliopsis zonata CBS 506.65]|uniref:Uncharacterized protein n=1 Tax=Penicilliopsis zonata CBS 506.65 TaxID=1073090 RepID=A0A1L9SM23_9EURO|nr:hypothetical protein ASPZODRAFT_130318 [Penicilliopsis zonata CBS 506.65]OJJ48332.1 hypothetical protein ASPZODRAFT_130318 [Penicilliopsis zonata CBS 506.65]